jgi:hypothetical protein
MEAFVYCWTDHKDNKLYVGSRKGHTADGYICSSKYMMEQYKIRPQDFTRQIIAEGSFADIRKLEEIILKTDNAAKSKHYYNQSNSDGKFVLKFHTEVSKRAISIGNKGNKRPDLSEKNKLGLSTEIRQKISDNHHDVSGKNNPMFGKKHKSESIKKMSSNKIGKGTGPKSVETRKKMAAAKKLYWDKKKGIVE